jgi:iron-sulfur cluster assembly protein
MLMLTENATRVIGALSDNPDLPDGAGLRIVTAPEGLSVSPASGPDVADQVVEEANARVFLEPDAAIVLDDKVLDAHVDDDGQVQFMLGQQ